jgi:ABC transporter substrate binding protein (PQQ-dependent alcohol dehydrogenase system)
MSSSETPGYENRIAEILADELNATLSFEWTHLDAGAVQRTLLAGTCDLIIGMAEGASGVLNTVPFLRAPYVFVSLPDRDLQISSFDDPELRELRIGTYQGGIPGIALGHRGIGANVSEYPPVATPGGPDRDARILDAVLSGEVDIGVAYGPAAAGRAAREATGLTIIPVSPEVEFAPSLLQMFRTWTVGVRPADTSLRDRLDIAITRRWTDIQAVLDSYGIPKLSITPPAGIPQVASDETRVAVITPSRSVAPLEFEALGEAANRGAAMAEYSIGRDSGNLGVPYRVLYASAPDDAAAFRAAGRLLATEKPAALIGGFGLEQASRLSDLAAANGVLFFNIAANDDSLRNSTCLPNTFHVEASASMYVEALIDWYRNQDSRRWFIVAENTAAGAALQEFAARTLTGLGLEVAGSAAVAPRQFVYAAQFGQIRESAADTVLLLLSAAEQELFLAQYESAGLAATVTGLSAPEAQTREVLYGLSLSAPASGTAARAVLWEASLANGSAGELNDVFRARSGEPMTSTAWASYAAVMIMYNAAVTGVTHDAEALRAYLLDPESTFGIGKDSGVYFRSRDQQLLQPLSIVRVDPQAPWGRTASARTALVELLGELQPLGEPALDPVGGSEGTCGTS